MAQFIKTTDLHKAMCAVTAVVVYRYPFIKKTGPTLLACASASAWVLWEGGIQADCRSRKYVDFKIFKCSIG